jgi:ribonuclease VapC
MILDSSALIAMIMAEAGHEKLLAKMKSTVPAGIGAPTVLESAVVLSRRFGREHSFAAIRAFMQYGKGRHPAALNFGDCMVYAVASTANQPLLFVGSDFSQTDLIPA